MPASSVHELALARVRAAERLEAAIAAAGEAYRIYQKATQALEEYAAVDDLARYVEVPLILHLARAGFGAFLEWRLTGTPAALPEAVQNQHGRLGL